MLIPMMVLSRVGIIDFEERDIRWSRSESYTFARMRTIADSRNQSFRCKSSKAKATYWACLETIFQFEAPLTRWHAWQDRENRLTPNMIAISQLTRRSG